MVYRPRTSGFSFFSTVSQLPSARVILNSRAAYSSSDLRLTITTASALLFGSVENLPLFFSVFNDHVRFVRAYVHALVATV